MNSGVSKRWQYSLRLDSVITLELHHQCNQTAKILKLSVIKICIRNNERKFYSVILAQPISFDTEKMWQYKPHKYSTVCPTCYRTRHFFNNFMTSEDIATTTATHYSHTLQTHTTDTHYRHTLHPHTTATYYNHTLQTHITDTHYSHTTATHYRHTLQPHNTDTHYSHTLQPHTTDTHYRHTLQTHTTDTHCRHTLRTHITDTHYRHTLQTHYRHTLQTHTTDTH